MKTPLASTDISTADHKKFDKVIEKFDAFFRVRKNVIFERAKFNQRIQGPDESVEQFITCLYSLSDTCKYGNLRDEMIRDRIVVGIRDRSLSERLQLDAGLTLESAKTRARQREAVHEQQSVLRNAPKQEVAVDWVSRKPPRRPSYKPRPPDSGQCSRCGKERHPRNVCPAKDAICHTSVLRRVTTAHSVGQRWSWRLPLLQMKMQHHMIPLISIQWGWGSPIPHGAPRSPSTARRCHSSSTRGLR